MNKLFAFCAALFTVLLTGIHFVSAQEATDTLDIGWPVEERCVGKPTKPPQGWSYDGTILMTGYGGIHGINAKWDTPRVVASASPYTFRGGIADGSAGLSPDKKWYGTFDSDTVYSETYNHLVNVKAIVVYSTSNPKEVYRVPWKNSWLYMWGPRRMLWADNSHLIYETSEYAEQKPGQLYEINPFDGTTAKWDGKADLAYFSGYPSATEIIPSHQYPSPNLKWTLKLKLNEGWGIYDVQSDTLIKKLDIDADPFAFWSPDSSTFFSEINKPKDNPIHTLALFDQVGTLNSILMSVEDDALNTQNAGWSFDTRFFAFLVETYQPKHNRRLFIADLIKHQILDTCLNAGRGVAWSPKGSQLAMFLPTKDHNLVAILDIEANSLYVVGQRIANDRDLILGWRVD